MSEPYLLIGLTGSIGAGKSMVATIFSDEGIPVLSADDIAKELMVSNAELRREIVEAFGEDSYREGKLNREYLSATIFTDEKNVERMNALVHPRTIAEQGIRAKKLVDAGNSIVVCEAALIFETGGEGRFDYIVVVDADPEIRYERAARRDGKTVEQITRRDTMQMPSEKKVEAADFVILNNGNLEELREKTGVIVTMLRSLPPRDHLERSIEDEEE